MPKRGVIFASDERLNYCGLFLQENGYEVQIVRTPEEWIPEKVRVSDLDFVFLPIRGTEDGSIQMNGTRMDLRSLLEELKAEAKVLAGLWSDYVRFLPCSFVCYQEDLEFAAKNSLLTAEGVLHLLLRKTPRSLFSYTYDVVGGGRVGTAVCDLLRRLGLSVRLVSHSGRKGAVPLEEWQNAGRPSDVVVNTATAPVITEAFVRTWSGSTPSGGPGSASGTVSGPAFRPASGPVFRTPGPVRVFDLSSRMAGTEPAARTHENIIYIAAPPLPGLVAPESAGQLLAQAFLRSEEEASI